jgi:serine/threonine-protein kinase
MNRIAGRYQITAKLGEGGMGVVYRAYDPAPMDREVAVKTLHEFTDPFALELFYKECGALKSISHPNIVEIFDIGEFDDDGHKKPFFVMPLLQGQTLDELIQKASHRLTVERVVEILSQTCRGLQAAHDRGLIHRDLKPSNIFVMADDSVKIIDFGVAHTADSNTRSAGFDKGTLLYMAPEQLQHKPVSIQSDVYSLGLTAYEALTRRQPFRVAAYETAIQAILSQIPPPASELNPAVSQMISRVVHKAMAKQPWNRYDSAREFGETLQKAARNEPIALFDPSRTQPRIQTASRALEKGDYQFAGEIVGELEAEGNIDPQITMLRTQIDQVVRQKTIAQLLDSARARFEEAEDPLALQKLQEVLQLDPGNVTALGLRSKIEARRHDRQIEKWMQLARQHVDNHSYGHAREALQNALLLRPKDSRASRLLKDIEAEEQEYVRVRRQKTEIYQSAVNAWKNGEVSQALSQMKHVLELDRRAPDVSSPDAAGMYQNFYNKIRSEHEEINNSYAEARRYLADKNFAKALQICREFLDKYPGHALFQALKFDIDEQQRQQLSGFIADIDRRLDAEPDLDAKVNLLREAVADYPDEPHFSHLLTLFESKRELVNSIVERARIHEESGLIQEAVSDLETLQTIYGAYPGLKFEQERLQKRLEQHTRDAARARWIRQIDQQLDGGNYSRALELLEKAYDEFPSDAELVELHKLAHQGLERATQVEKLIADGQALCGEGQYERGIELLKNSLQLDDRPTGRLALCDVYVEWGHRQLKDDWRAAELLADRALELDATHGPARSLRAQALDTKRDELVAQHASQARRLQSSGDIDAAIAEVNNGLTLYPADPRLRAIFDALTKESDRRRGRTSDLRTADLETLASPTPRTSEAPPREDQTVSVRSDAAPSARPRVLTVPVMLDSDDLMETRAVPRSGPAPSQVPEPVTLATPPPSAAPEPQSPPAPARAAAPQQPRKAPQPRRWVYGAAAAGAAAVVLLIGFVSLNRGAVPESVESTAAVTAVDATPAPDAPAIEGATVATPPAAVATLSVGQLPPGTRVAIDGAPVGTVGTDGGFQYTSVKPGRHTIVLSRDTYEPVTLLRDFTSGRPVQVSAADVTFRPAAVVVEFLADAGTNVTVSQGDQTLHQFAGATKLPLAEGTYQVVARGPANLPTTETLLVTPGAIKTVDLRNIASGIEQFETGGWTRAENWFTRRGGGFVLYKRTAPKARVTFTVKPDRSRNPFSSGPRIKWLLAFVDVRNYVLAELSNDALYRTEIVNGARRELPRIAHKIPSGGEFLHLSVEVSDSQIVHQFNTGSGWQVLDTWSRMTPVEGRFGFYLPGSETLEVSNFRYDASF